MASMTATDRHTRRFHLTPGHCLLALLAVEFLLFLSQWFRWLPKGWPVLIAVAAVGVVMLGMFVWFGVALVFRRRFQFSLRSLLVLVVVVALPCSWMAVEMKKARQQKAAAERINSLGGWIGYYYDPKDPFAVLANPCPAWLCSSLGETFFGDVTYANVEGIDAELECLQAFPQLETLCLTRGHVTGRRLEDLKHLPSLTRLDLSYCEATNASLERLQVVTRIKDLDLWHTEINDSGLEQFQALTRLNRLNLDATRITDVGLNRLKALIQLQELRLGGTHVTDAGMESLKNTVPASSGCPLSTPRSLTRG